MADNDNQSAMKTTLNNDFILGIALFVLALLAIFVIIPAGIDSPGDVNIRALAPDFWPNIVMTFLAIIGLIIAIQGYATGKKTTQKTPIHTRYWRAVSAIILLFIYYWLLQTLGFVIASCIALLAFCLLAGERRLYYVLPLAILLPLLLFYFFTHIATVAIPLGISEDWPLFN